MTWSSYGAYVLISIGLVLIPGPDTFVVLRAALAGGLLSAAGVFTASALQGMAAAFGLGILITQSPTAFTVLRWAGVARIGAMPATEALILGLVGGLVGVVLGTVFDLAATRVINDDVLLTIPFGTVAALLAGSGAAGVLASLLAMRSAARQPVVESLSIA